MNVAHPLSASAVAASTAAHAAASDDAVAQDARIAASTSVDVSVVVPTWRRPALLETCLHALAAQHLDCARYEIIVCDDGPDDATRTLVDRFAAAQLARGGVVRYMPVTATQGPAAARNVGWRIARAPLIAFTDDDTIPSPHWLRAGIAAAAAHDADAVSGRIEMPLPDLPTDYERDASGLARAEFATANVFVRRAALAAAGGFDERFTAAWREDSDLQFTLLAAGRRIVRADDAVVIHPVRPARWGVSLQQQKKSRFDALLFRKHPALFRQRIGARPPLRYYATVACAVFACVAWLAGKGTPGVVAAALWALLTAQFCAQRLRGTRRHWRHLAEMVWTSMLIPFLSVYWRLYGALRFGVVFL
ncbi:glycosyltransferase family 2 protein [Paraburkholderia rhizosphaerae]|uniref:Cellulose synthase/poly-beta-1,6-N-acetylglucosamine synthase-like glycosyltransferase n=1 Tax=Paraburkholderia rhizosphaerae TaxID=480658 RepID=A0A4R8LLM1_9BURK|nr:glycosyltransferase [Paraburkholderia rhizosphaerae]TDY43907.1 cellulose synthase/poly-beta-1,6-N-acetylglucosamine synthase-like glycosyltransferase [Paraburkholderia rhizosphaerae]